MYKQKLNKTRKHYKVINESCPSHWGYWCWMFPCPNCSFLHLILLFWNQTLTCETVRLSDSAKSHLKNYWYSFYTFCNRRSFYWRGN